MKRIDYRGWLAAFGLSLAISGAAGLASYLFYVLIDVDVNATASVVIAVLLAIALTPSAYRRIREL